jgi:hypothetical protein
LTTKKEEVGTVTFSFKLENGSLVEYYSIQAANRFIVTGKRNLSIVNKQEVAEVGNQRLVKKGIWP